MGRVIGYIRVSTADQAEHGQSLDAQREMISRYCELHHLGTPEIVEDAGLSGKTMDRPGLQGILGGVRLGEVDHVVVTAIDRLSRSTRDILHLVVDLFDGHTGFHSVKQQLDTSSAMGRFVLTQWAAVAELERGVTVERITDALAEKQRKGERVGRTPYGFVDGPGELVVDPDRMAVVAEMFGLRSNGARLQQIADVLNDRGVESPRGGRWHPSSVKYILDNRALYGRHIVV